MRTRVDLQPAKTLTADARQPANEAARIGSMRNGVVFLNVFDLPQATGTVSFLIDTASDLNLGDSAQDVYWTQLASQTLNVTGTKLRSYKFTITDFGEAIRWRVTGLTNNLSFSCVVFLTDQ